ncbi:MAG: hypothetical protein DRN81_05675 [Thermoproteota archaeon]|nr:MAG: hypothetical protein DRN81_05675 [Candidatus Korarchaeota archaeon]
MICTRSVSLQYGSFSWKKIEDALRIRGILIREGTFTGIDGHTIYYPAEVIQEAMESIVGKPIKSRHADRDVDVIGFWTAARQIGDAVEVEGVIFNKDEIERIMNAEKTGISVEAEVECEEVPGYDAPVARKITFHSGAVVENPACPTCRVESIARIRLAKENGGKKEMPEEEFLKTLEEQLKKAGIDEETIKAIIEALKAKYPQPTQTAQTRQETITVQDIEAAVKEVLETELEKPTRAAFLRWLRKQFKEAGFDRAAIGKILAVIKKAIKTPYPYPYPAPKKVKGEKVDLEGIWDETVEELENTVDKLETEIEQKEQELQELRAKLKEMQDAELRRKEEAVIALINQIKEIDESFDEKKFLEGVSDVDTKQKVLQSYLETVQRLKPAIKLAGVHAPPEGEKKIEQVIMQMFGTTNLDEIIKTESE